MTDQNLLYHTHTLGHEIEMLKSWHLLIYLDIYFSWKGNRNNNMERDVMHDILQCNHWRILWNQLCNIYFKYYHLCYSHNLYVVMGFNLLHNTFDLYLQILNIQSQLTSPWSDLHVPTVTTTSIHCPPLPI